MEIFNSKMDTNYSEDNIKLCLFTTENPIAECNTFCKKYFLEHLWNDIPTKTELKRIATKAVISEYIDGILIRKNIRMSNKDMLQNILHEIAHIFCVHNEIKEGIFYKEYYSI